MKLEPFLPHFFLCFKTELESVKAQSSGSAACGPDLNQGTPKARYVDNIT